MIQYFVAFSRLLYTKSFSFSWHFFQIPDLEIKNSWEHCCQIQQGHFNSQLTKLIYTFLTIIEVWMWYKWFIYLIIFSYSLSLPLESLHFRNITEASTLAGENVFGSFSRDIMLNNTVLKLDKMQHSNSSKQNITAHKNIIQFMSAMETDLLSHYIFVERTFQYVENEIVVCDHTSLVGWVWGISYCTNPPYDFFFFISIYNILIS